MIACVQVGEYFPLLQRSLHSFPRQQCDRPQGAGNPHHLPHPRSNQPELSFVATVMTGGCVKFVQAV